ncbi:UNVERIFIED_CONTAM: hypothetical protein K2H54_040141 [Gekko kuhli]
MIEAQSTVHDLVSSDSEHFKSKLYHSNSLKQYYECLLDMAVVQNKKLLDQTVSVPDESQQQKGPDEGLLAPAWLETSRVLPSCPCALPNGKDHNDKVRNEFIRLSRIDCNADNAEVVN